MDKLSLSRQFARWAANLKYQDLHPAVADKARALLLHALAGAALGSTGKRAQQAAAQALKEEGRPDGATLLALGGKAGGRATRAGAAYANAEIIAESGLVDSYRMLTHPGPILIAAALANAELEGRSGSELLAALAAGYEFTLRLCDDFIPATAARGFRPNPIYCTLGAALASGKLLGQDEDALVATIAVAANFAGGLFESALTGGGSLNTPQAARNGVQAALIAGEGHIKGTEQILEGRAGFYNAFIGNHRGEFSHSFEEGVTRADPLDITRDLGRTWKLLTVMLRMYSTSGYNQPVIDLIAEMKREHGLDAADMAELSVKMNWVETLYPSPAYPRRADWDRPGTGTTHFYAAYAAVYGGYPVVGGAALGDGKPKEDQRVLGFMNRVHLVPEKNRALFSPAVVITLKDGRRLEGEYPYRRMALNFDQLVEQLQRCLPGYPGGKAALDGLVQAVRSADKHASVAPLIRAVTGSA